MLEGGAKAKAGKPGEPRAGVGTASPSLSTSSSTAVETRGAGGNM